MLRAAQEELLAAREHVTARAAEVRDFALLLQCRFPIMA